CRLQDDLGRRARSVPLRRPGWQELTAAARRIGSRALAALLFAAFLWGVAEAIYFFVVADVLLTFIAVAYGLRAALVASLAAALGAACGGALVWRLAQADPVQAVTLLRSVPFLSEAMIGKGLAAWRRPTGRSPCSGAPSRAFPTRST